MKQKWQKSRNYRRFKNENGEVVRRVITVDDIDVEVSEEIFLAYSQAERRERYIAEEVEPGLVLSLDKLIEDRVPLQKLGIVWLNWRIRQRDLGSCKNCRICCWHYPMRIESL